MGILISYETAPIYNSSILQICAALSSTETEYIELTE